MSTPPARSAAVRCPLCGGENRCAEAAGDPRPCWCKVETFPPALLERLPPEQRGKSCICRDCLDAFTALQRSGEGGPSSAQEEGGA